ncbi:MAG: hypothetical protein SFU98_00035 [Leptospiraceae bacterium]|nr:hypothetical protein [Leptospiraceae bacterium]
MIARKKNDANQDYKMDIDLFKKEIDLIQDVIKRMASNSFLIKGWMITIVTGVIAFGKDGINIERLILGLVPLLTFWILDAYFLQQERLFRKLYEWVIIERPKSNHLQFDMKVNRFSDKVDGKIKIMFSSTFLVFYGFTFFLILLYIMKLHWFK